MAASYETHYWNQFNGGLNLTTQTQSLAGNESPDALNMDFGLRGGFTLRGGFQTQVNNSALTDARFICYGPLSTDRVLMQGQTGQLISWNGSITVTGNDLTDNDAERVVGAVFNSYAYMVNGRLAGNLVSRSWNGTTFRTLTNTFNDDYLAPAAQGAGSMPLARVVAQHQGFLWVGDTTETGVRFPGRIRFSHEQNPENFATLDWIGVGDPGEPVTDLVPFGSMLLVFKRDSVWAVYGYDRDTWVLERVAESAGTAYQGAVAVNSGVAYWFSTDGQLMAYNGRGITYLSEPLRWWSDTGKIKHGGAHRLMWADGRLWMALEAGASETPVTRYLFLWDASVKAFTRYSPQVTDLMFWPRTGADGDMLFITTTAGNLYRYDRTYVNDIDNVTAARIDGYYRTAWFSAGETATLKRFKRPRVTAASKSATTVKVDVFHDFNDLVPARTQTFEITVPAGTSLWNGTTWNGGLWSEEADEYYEFARLGASGSARAVSYKFSSSNNPGRWWIDSITIPFRRKRVK
jgi:hypothetical protein